MPRHRMRNREWFPHNHPWQRLTGGASDRECPTCPSRQGRNAARATLSPSSPLPSRHSPEPAHSSSSTTGVAVNPHACHQPVQGPVKGACCSASTAALAGFWARPGAGDAGQGHQGRSTWAGTGALTALTATTEVSEDVIALLREGDLVHSVPDEARLEQPTGVLPGLPALRKALHVMIQPVHHVRAWIAKDRERPQVLASNPRSQFWSPPLPPHTPPAQNPAIPRKALGMVILSHMRSRTSSPDSGAAMALVTDAMSVWMERPRPSQPDGRTIGESELGPRPMDQWSHIIPGSLPGSEDEMGRGAHHQEERTQR